MAKTKKSAKRSRGGGYAPGEKALAKARARSRAAEPDGKSRRPSWVERLAALPRRTLWISAVGTAVALIGVALLVQLVLAPSGPVTATVIDARDAFLDTSRLHPGDTIRPGPIRVRGGGHLALQIDEARLDVDDAAQLMVRPDGLWLRDGAARVNGPLFASGAGCEVDLRGATRIEIVERGMRITLAGGEATPRPDGASRCAITGPDGAPQ